VLDAVDSLKAGNCSVTLARLGGQSRPTSQLDFQ